MNKIPPPPLLLDTLLEGDRIEYLSSSDITYELRVEAMDIERHLPTVSVAVKPEAGLTRHQSKVSETNIRGILLGIVDETETPNAGEPLPIKQGILAVGAMVALEVSYDGQLAVDLLPPATAPAIVIKGADVT